jgi:hypothetical protein
MADATLGQLAGVRDDFHRATRAFIRRAARDNVGRLRSVVNGV